MAFQHCLCWAGALRALPEARRGQLCVWLWGGRRGVAARGEEGASGLWWRHVAQGTQAPSALTSYNACRAACLKDRPRSLLLGAWHPRGTRHEACGATP